MKLLLILALLSGRGLKSLYNDYNTIYFQQKLPRNTIIDREEKHGIYGYTHKEDEVFYITMSTSYKMGERYDALTLLHEMCHIQEWDEADKLNKLHGPKWKACMYRLKAAGAFDELLIEGNE